ncbi:amidase family protein [Streptomyces sp. NPDC008125]|uniref:amidase family protein n=1 Tax=Streptomyces sp. NPDC008125 TaxID=3364811 RepID=UPI0036EDD213
MEVNDMAQFFPGAIAGGTADGPDIGRRDDDGTGTGPAAAGHRAMPSILSGSLRDRFRAAAENPEWAKACAESGRQWARDADERYRAISEMHPTRQPLLRVGVKDNIHCAGFSTRAGSRRFRTYPGETAAVLAGVPADHITCKTQLTEATLGLDAGCGNPLAPGGWPGASSTGSAVAVAANICDVAVGTDSLGSVRIPSMACGVVGLRMTHDEALLDGVLPVSPSLDAVGWFARTLDDLRFALERFEVVEPLTPAERKPLRVALVTEVLGDDDCEPGILRAYEALTDTTTGHGVDVVRIALGDAWKARLPAWALCAREAFDSLSPHTGLLDPLGEDVANVLRLGEGVARHEAEEVRALQRPLGEELRARLDALEIDAFVLPVYPFTLPSPEAVHSWPMLFPDVRDPAAEALAGYTPIASLLGWPALSVPTGGQSSGGGRQLGVQLVGRPGAEGLLIEMAERMFA